METIHITDKDYQALANMVVDESYSHSNDFKCELEYDKEDDSWRSTLHISAVLFDNYDKYGDFKDIALLSAYLETAIESGNVSNDFDFRKLQNEIFAL